MGGCVKLFYDDDFDSIATAISNLPFYARVARAEVSILRNACYVQAARLSGNGDARIVL